MYIKYGTYQFDAGEAFYASFTARRTYNERQRVRFVRYIAIIEGELLACNGTGGLEYGLNNQIKDLIDAFAVNGKTLALYNTNGNLTRHYILGDTGAAQVVVPCQIQFHQWPDGGVAEYASKRKFRIHAEGWELVDGPAETWWREEIIRVGSGGPHRRLQPTQTGIWEEDVYPATPVKYIQRGEAVGFYDYPSSPLSLFTPSPFTPLLPLGYEVPGLRKWNPKSGVLKGVQYFDYGFEWEFVFEMPNAPDWYPRT